MTLYRGVIPAWMEVFKRNLPADHKHKTFSYATIVSFAVCSLLSLLIGPLLDDQPTLWRWILTATALLGSLAYFFQRKIPISFKPEVPSPSWTLAGHVLDPWKKAFAVLKQQTHFRYYVIGFMVLGGSGLMVLQPALPLYFVDVLGLSYTELAVALNTCKGIGLIVTSLFWAKAMPRTHISRFAALILFLAALFPLVLLSAQLDHIWVYVAYLGYGIMQAGSELTWHLSGPHFSGSADSSRFTNVNILVVGLRGFLVPQLGALLCLSFAPVSVLLLATVCCLSGTCFMLLFAKKNTFHSRCSSSVTDPKEDDEPCHIEKNPCPLKLEGRGVETNETGVEVSKTSTPSSGLKERL